MNTSDQLWFRFYFLLIQIDFKMDLHQLIQRAQFWLEMLSKVVLQAQYQSILHTFSPPKKAACIFRLAPMNI